MDFKERVSIAAIQYAPIYKSVFIDFEYLICASCFTVNDYYVLSAKEDNYQHLIGVHTPNLSPLDFFIRCVDGTLCPTDFDFIKKGRPEKEIKGSVRKKIKAMPYYVSMMNQPLMVQENFAKNSIMCSLAASDASMTIGYISNAKSVPKSLMFGNYIDPTKSAPVDLILRKKAGATLFDQLYFGDSSSLMRYLPKIQHIVSIN